MFCPQCGGKTVGRIGAEQYYCWDCCVEYDSRQHVFQIEEDGSLVNMVAENES